MSLNTFLANKTALLKNATLSAGLVAGMLLGKNDTGPLSVSKTSPYTSLVHPLRADDSELLGLIIQNESYSAQFYLDTGGKKSQVTIGIGKLVPNEEAALNYPVCKMDEKDRLTHVPATDEEIKDAYRIIKNQKHGKNYTAEYYTRFTRVGLHKSDAKKILAQDLAGTIHQLHNIFPQFNHMPRGIQFTLVDLRFNLGSKFDEKRWKTFYDAINSGQIDVARKSCHRIGVGSRNETIENLLEQGEDQLEDDWRFVSRQKNLSLSLN